jgi:hypothetical protein
MKLGAHFPQPAAYVPSEEFAIRITGIGGTRLVTVARIVADAAHLARLRVRALVQTVFGPDATYAWRLHPPLLHQLGRRRKIALDRWATPLFVTLRGGRRLRGTAFDPFGRFAVRRVERRLAGEYTTVVEEVVPGLHGGSHALAVEIAALPVVVRRYECGKLANVVRCDERLRALRAEFATTIAAVVA